VLANVVSYEENVKAVLSKVSLGEADAGIVYTTDAAAIVDGSIATIAIPDALNSIASYPIAPTKHSSHAALAQRFVDYVLSPAGQQILVSHGFMAGAP
jgi:molybdate transport system substrate-binding protein